MIDSMKGVSGRYDPKEGRWSKTNGMVTRGEVVREGEENDFVGGLMK